MPTTAERRLLIGHHVRRLSRRFATSRSVLPKPPVALRSLLLLGVLTVPFAAFGEQRLISVGDRRLSIDCGGQPARHATVVLITGAGRTAKDWAKVQPEVATFVRVCSYDRAGLGDSGKTAKPQSVDEIVDDLHTLLEVAGEKKPYILVGHSIAGIYARRFATKFSRDTAALAFVDSSHEEQLLRLREIDPAGPGLSDEVAIMGFFIKPGERLDWHTEVPLIVLGRGQPFPRSGQLTEEQFTAWDRIWQEMQEDLAKRSPTGQYRRAAKSGHFIQNDQPDLVVQAIRELCRLR